MDENLLVYGDNLDVMRGLPAASVDLIYLDPPFNSNADYDVLFANRDGDDARTQIEAFEDTWRWTPETEVLYQELIDGGAVPLRVADAIEAMRGLLGPSDAMSYQVMMAPRLAQLHRLLTKTGTLYLHCDPTASHYLKVILDAIFDPRRCLSEVIWQRTSAHNRTTRYGPVHDVILAYTKSDEWTWNPQHVPYAPSYVESNYRNIEEGTGRRYSTADLTSNNPGSTYEWKGMPPPSGRYWGVSKETMERLEGEGRLYHTRSGIPRRKNYLDEMPGRLLQDVWTDINPLGAQAAERLGYPTQKPLALMERIIKASSNPGDVVLDPFCGCGTTVDAAQSLGRRWIGIDVTYIAIDLITKRLRDTHGDEVMEQVDVRGIPRDVAGAQALFDRNEFDFERWAVSEVDGQPNEQQRGDKGIDGVIRFPLQGAKTGRAIVSVKGGRNLTRGMVQELSGAVEEHGAAMGVLVTLHEPTKGMKDAVARGGTYTWPVNGQTYPKLQLITVSELLNQHNKPDLPPAFLPYVKAQRLVEQAGEQASLFG